MVVLVNDGINFAVLHVGWYDWDNSFTLPDDRRAQLIFDSRPPHSVLSFLNTRNDK